MPSSKVVNPGTKVNREMKWDRHILNHPNDKLCEERITKRKAKLKGEGVQ